MGQLIAWFIIGFALSGLARWAGWLPLAVAALGLSADPRAERQAGRPVILAVICSLAALVALSSALVNAPGRVRAFVVAEAVELRGAALTKPR